LTVQTWAKRFKWTQLRDKTLDVIVKGADNALSDSVQRSSERFRAKAAADLEQSIEKLPKHSTALDKFVQRETGMSKLIDRAAKVFGWASEGQQGQALTLLCLSSTDAVSQGLVRPVEVESTVQPVPVQTTQDSSGQGQQPTSPSDASSTTVEASTVQS